MGVDISPFIKDAQKIQKETGIPASIILGQIMLESGGRYSGGLSGLAVQGKNLFGIKGTGTAGSVYMPTTEYQNGKYVSVTAPFRKYNSYYESMQDHAKLLSSSRYATHLTNAKSVNEFAEGIKKGGYATDPNYVSKLLGVIDKNNLHQYDSGNIDFKPITDTGTGDSSPSLPDTSKLGMTETIFYHTLRSIFILLLFVLMVVFFLKAFPAVGDTATNLVPATRTLKTVAKGVK